MSFGRLFNGQSRGEESDDDDEADEDEVDDDEEDEEFQYEEYDGEDYEDDDGNNLSIVLFLYLSINYYLADDEQDF